MYDSGGLVRVMPDSLSTGRHGPWVLAGVPGGEVRITNGWLPPGALRLWRFANLGQAGCAAAVIRRHARLSDDGWAWEVADVADHRPIHDIAGQLAALRAWARSLEPEIEAALIGRGPGHYPLLERTQGDA
jgi:hypothetical protein